MKKTARDKLITAAEALMLSRGYASTSVDEICEAAGVSKGSFYHFFRTKEDLGLAVLDAFHARSGGIMAKGVKKSADPVDRSLALVDHIVDSAGVLWGKGCLLGSFALDLAETNPTIRKAVSDKFRQVAAALGEGLEPLGSEEEDGAELAEQFLVIVEGALVLAKAHDDWGYVERALERFRTNLHKRTEAAA